MSARYSKILTRQNVQMFIGGALLATTLGHWWLQSHLERAIELQRRLRQVQRHMYWSMSLTQRVDVSSEEKPTAYFRQQRLRATSGLDAWWNSKIFGLSSWIVAPGYLTKQAGRVQGATYQHVSSEWDRVKEAAGDSGSWMVDQIKVAVHWEKSARQIKLLWEEEKLKWQQAHTAAVKAVHPDYSKN
ncbi:hypothetical protein COEREDRAFT_6698 [Coemansia reversa NRRL 1564]|uniref:Uncharacterized protein n=1 Tax=Coemansia reversa (strain ATCC 12441 / NRRL 1564) TaxID=763665 RepID=A0A2G5BI85_COERN|nr:hypothetical protein COEREDRAFT_6698 [Coemansia reversa NRRL 1564]|eukprot:PIA18467.1 hypothetical protein COEREDRAFT_6698 [Coemansia reversa NRRL 1564]